MPDYPSGTVMFGLVTECLGAGLPEEFVGVLFEDERFADSGDVGVGPVIIVRG